MSPSQQPNILFIVLDACRLDYAKENAPELQSLSESGIWFENAVAPATWSLPSHASLFTGKYPHDHGITQPSNTRMPTELIEELKEEGYHCFGASGNGFTSPLWDFDQAFDSFRYTQTPEPFISGMEAYTPSRKIHDKEDISKLNLFQRLAGKSIHHENPMRSLANVAAVGLNHLARTQMKSLQRIPHPVFSSNIQETYSADKNTRLIENTIENSAEKDNPFFLFANYMDTHRPYSPDQDLQRKHCGRKVPSEEVQRLNDELAAPWEFIRKEKDDQVDAKDVETLRGLYAGSVESVDEHIRRIVQKLEKEGLREDTLLIVTADHGENLGEQDVMGQRRFGHEASVSDNLARVPLVISHPDLDEKSVEKYVPLKELYTLIKRTGDSNIGMNEINISEISSKIALCEYPALGDDKFRDEHPEIDDQFADQRVSMNSVVAYKDDWRLILESGGREVAICNSEVVPADQAPSDLYTAAKDALNKLSKLRSTEISSDTSDRLKELGYL